MSRFGVIVNPDPEGDPEWYIANAHREITHISFDALPYFLLARRIGGICVKRHNGRSETPEKPQRFPACKECHEKIKAS